MPRQSPLVELPNEGAGAPAPDRTPDRVPALEELTSAQRALVARRHELMLLLDRGVDRAAALQTVGLTHSASWLRKVRRRYHAHGLAGLYDGRWGNRHLQLAEAVRAITLGWYCALRGAGPSVIHAKTVASCEAERLTPPSYSWVVWYLAHLDPSLKLARTQGLDAWTRQGAPVGRYEPAAYGNDVWQLDHTPLDLWCKAQRRDGTWVPFRPWLTVAVDVYTRAVASLFVSARPPDAWTTALLLRKGILPKPSPAWPVCGVPRIVVPDHGKDFRAHAVAASLAALGILLDCCPQHYPNMKGEIERFFRTLQGAVLPALRGYTKAGMQSEGAARRHLGELLTLQDLKPLLERWIVDVYHHRVHEGISAGAFDRTPLAYWQETVRLRTVAERELDVLLLQSDKVRTVTNVGIKLTLPGTGRMVFTAPELAERWRERVRIRYNPEDLASILVYSATTHERICEAYRQQPDGTGAGAYTNRDLVRERRRVRAGLVERMRRYTERVEASDRESPRAWDSARTRAVHMNATRKRATSDAAPCDPLVADAADSVSPGVLSLMAAMEQRDRRLS